MSCYHTSSLLNSIRPTGNCSASPAGDQQESLGHANRGTTTRYTKADAARPFQSVEAFFNAALDGADEAGGAAAAYFRSLTFAAPH
ncbi:hypothetical protein GR157_34170 [Burkholderia sp. 4701]|nr:hypothetical protein [Burkholderia sp. 4701]MXN87035.1 hypothetical protein [Burkholderia sp. 4812]